MNVTKTELRRQMRRLKASHTAAELQSLSAAVVHRLLLTEAWQQAHPILLYHSLPDEVETHSLIAEAALTKTVLLPVVVGDDLILRYYSATAQMTVGAFGIGEPTGTEFTDYADIDLAVVPGMAFTADGCRLGRGRGYYDRLLPRLTRALKIGLCWPFQLVDTMPTTHHDVRMDAVVA